MPAGRFRTTTDPTAPIIPGRRPPPPDDLTPEQQAEWSAITARLPVGWFTGENFPMLRELCRHVDYSNMLAGKIDAALAADNSEALASLLRLHSLQSERIAILSTKLRLTKASRYTRDAEAAAIASRDADGPRPWIDDVTGRPYRKQ